MKLEFDEGAHRYTYNGSPVPSVSALLDLIPKINEDGSNNILRRSLSDDQVLQYRRKPNAKFHDKTNEELALGFWGSNKLSMHQSADHGTVVHDALEDFANGKSLDTLIKKVTKKDEELKEQFVELSPWYIFPTGSDFREIQKEPLPFEPALPKFKQGVKFIKESGYKVVGQEERVVNEELIYAGTFDLRTEKDKKKYIMDYKTSRWGKNKKSNISKLKKYGLQMDAYEMCINDFFSGKAVVWLFADKYELHFTDSNHNLIKRIVNIYHNMPSIRALLEEFNAGADTKVLAAKHNKTEEDLTRFILNLNLSP